MNGRVAGAEPIVLDAPRRGQAALPMPVEQPTRVERPTRENPRGTEPISTLFDTPSLAAERRVVRGPARLIRAYDGPLEIDLAADRPVVIANFAATMDGAVAMDRHGHSGGGDVSGFSPTDRFVMGLLRAVSDTIIVGAGTVRASRGRAWTPEAVAPEYAAEFVQLRRDLGLASRPTVLVVTATGDLDPRHPALDRDAGPTIVVGPAGALRRLASAGLSPAVETRTLTDLAPSAPIDLTPVLAEVGGRVALYEGGPHLFGALLAAGQVDELFLTLAPQLVGRTAGGERLSLVEQANLWPALPTWGVLRSVRSAGSHLLLRYRLGGTEPR